MSTGQANAGSRLQLPRWLLPALAVIGLAALAFGFATDPLRAYQSIQVNFVYWLGLCFAGITISAIYQLTDSNWGQHVKRLAESSVALIPVVLVAYLGVMAGNHALFHAGHHEFLHHGHHLNHAKEVWLSPAFLLTRDGIALILFSLLAIWFIRHQLRPSMGRAAAAGDEVVKKSKIAAWITSGYSNFEAEVKRSSRMRQILAPALVITYALVMTLICFDQIMSLDPQWISTLFGAYFFITSLFLAWASLSLFSVLARRGEGGPAMARYGKLIEVDDLHSLGKLLFAFCMLSADFFWSQFVVIWYGNIPEETGFVLRRVRFEPWSNVAWTVLILCYALPFGLLLFKKIKRTEVTLASIAVLIMVMVWVERFLLIVPSLWHETGIGLPLGITEIGVTLGFVGVAGLSYKHVVGLFVRALPEDVDDAAEAEPEAEEPEEEEPEEEPEADDEGADDEETDADEAKRKRADGDEEADDE